MKITKSRQFIIDIVLVMLAVVVLLPFIWMISTSLKGSEELFSYPPRFIPQKVYFSNFIRVCTEIPLGRGYINSLLISISITLLQLITCTCAAYAFAKLKFKGRNVLFFMYLATLIVPFHITMIPIFIAVRSIPQVLNSVFHTDIFTASLYCGSFYCGKLLGADSYLTLILPYSVSAYGTFLMRQYFLSIPDDILEAACMDGCTHMRIYWSMILPLSKPALATLTTITFMNSWKNYMWPLVTVNEPELMPLSVMMSWLQGVYSTEWSLLMAASVLVMIPVSIIFIINQKYLQRGLNTNLLY